MDHRVNFTVSDHEWKTIVRLSSAQRLKPATFSRSVFVRALFSEIALIDSEKAIPGYAQLDLFDSKPQLTIKRGKK